MEFYVYTLAYPDGTVFYVGKGTGNRIDAHCKEAKRGLDTYKCRVIRKIWTEGGQVLQQKIAFFTEESKAYEFEQHLIAFFGRDNLTNSTDGGEGASHGNKFALLYNKASMPLRVNGGLVELIDNYLASQGNIAPTNEDRKEAVEKAIRQHCTRIAEDQAAIII